MQLFMLALSILLHALWLGGRGDTHRGRSSVAQKGDGDGAAEKTRTSTGYAPTATSTLRVYQFRHSRKRCAIYPTPPQSGVSKFALHPHLWHKVLWL